MSEKYRIFVRSWYMSDGKTPNTSARKTTVGFEYSYAAAQDHCRVYNANHNPGKTSRKAEFERVK